MKNSEITCVIPLYNKAKTIASCVNAVLNQDLPVDNIVIVDDGSTDNSAEIVATEFSRYPHIKIIHQKNQGVSVARNVGIAAASGDLVFLCDADDEWLPTHTAELVKAHQADTEYDLYTTMHDVISVNVKIEPRYVDAVNFVDSQLRGRGMIHSSSVAINKKLWVKWPGFPPGGRRGEDTLVWMQIGQDGRICFVPKCSVVVHKNMSDGHAGRADVVPEIYKSIEILERKENRLYLRNHMRRNYLLASINDMNTVKAAIVNAGILGSAEMSLLSALGVILRRSSISHRLHGYYRRAKSLASVRFKLR